MREGVVEIKPQFVYARLRREMDSPSICAESFADMRNSRDSDKCHMDFMQQWIHAVAIMIAEVLD